MKRIDHSNTVPVSAEKTNWIFAIVSNGFQANQQSCFGRLFSFSCGRAKPPALFAKGNGVRRISPLTIWRRKRANFWQSQCRGSSCAYHSLRYSDNRVLQEFILALHEIKALRLIQPINNRDRNSGHILPNNSQAIGLINSQQCLSQS